MHIYLKTKTRTKGSKVRIGYIANTYITLTKQHQISAVPVLILWMFFTAKGDSFPVSAFVQMESPKMVCLHECCASVN